MTLQALKRRSMNAKTGRVALAISRTQDTCPSDCPLMGSGCYGENYGPGGSAPLFGRVDRHGQPVDDYAELASELARVAPGQFVRANVVGDYLTVDGTPDLRYIALLNAAGERGVRVLSYTHAWRRMDPLLFADSARPQASCDTPADVVEARAAGWSTVIVSDDVSPPGYVACPATTDAKLQCIDCGLCAKQRRSTIVFEPHGAKRRLVRERIAQNGAS